MVVFSKFITSQRGQQQLVDSDCYIHSHKKPKDTAEYTCWRCSARKFKCPAHVYLYANNELRVGAKPHNHDASVPVVEKKFWLVFSRKFFLGTLI